jgi:hypothetical protein
MEIAIPPTPRRAQQVKTRDRLSRVKYYLYISDAKVDMLLPQVPHAIKKKTATEMGFDLKVLKATRTTEEETEDDRITRLETVVAFIREYGNVGTIDTPDEFIDDTALMSFGPTDRGPMAYFAGETQQTIFGLAGSASHLIGNSDKSREWPSYSAVNYITRWLMEHDHGAESESYKRLEISHLICAMADDARKKGYPVQRLECFSKRLLVEKDYSDYWSKKNTQVLLATPLYVAMTT